MAAAAGLFQAAVGFVLVMVTNWVVRRIDRKWALF
jgi:putative aldouronate transport system permease protein